MDVPNETPRPVRCDRCGSIALARDAITCCDRPMDPVPTPESVASPGLEEVLQVVFGMSTSELDVCLCVMAGEGLTVKELASETGYDRSVIARHLGHLVDLGVLEKRRRLLERGGQVYVYSPRSAESVRRSLQEGFLGWTAAASTGIDGLTREKIEAIVDRGDRDPEWKLYQE